MVAIAVVIVAINIGVSISEISRLNVSYYIKSLINFGFLTNSVVPTLRHYVVGI